MENKTDWRAIARDQVVRTLAPVMIMSGAVAGWQFLSEGGIVELLGGVSALEFEEHLHDASAPAEDASLPPREIESAPPLAVYAGKVDVPNDNQETDVYSGTGPRGIFQDVVRFPEPCAGPPVVTVGLSEIDIDRDRDARIRIEINDVYPDSFIYSFSTWGDSQVNSASATWMAVGRLQPATAAP